MSTSPAKQSLSGLSGLSQKVTFREVTKRLASAPKHKKVNTSIFYFTVNSNRAVGAMTEEEIEHWEQQQRKLWRDEIYYLLTVHPDLQGVGEYNLVPEDDILSIDVELGFEIGPAQDRLHLHGIIRVRHTTKIRLAYKRINEILTEEMDGDAQYFRAIVRHDDIEDFRDYMSKIDIKIERYHVK